MRFTYRSYAELIQIINDCNYTIANYHNCDSYERVAILRHDVDVDLSKALEFAEFESSLGVTSTYFILLSCNFYNVFSKKSQAIIRRIQDMGHAVGLHFDETKYLISNKNEFEWYAQNELNIFENIVRNTDKSLSMHRPSKLALEGDLDFGEVVNSYSYKFFKEYKYLSDSRMNWREDVFSIIKSNEYDKLHILTHPLWYEKNEMSMKNILLQFLSSKNDEMFHELDRNIRDLDKVLPEQPRDFRYIPK